MRQKIPEIMWCFHCDHEWPTDDYFECVKCPNCETQPVKIYRTSSFSWLYAYMEKHPEKKPIPKQPT